MADPSCHQRLATHDLQHQRRYQLLPQLSDLSRGVTIAATKRCATEIQHTARLQTAETSGNPSGQDSEDNPGTDKAATGNSP
jgi:hypothetical protein